MIGSIIEGTSVDVDLRHGEIADRWADFVPSDWCLGVPVGVKEKTLLVAVPDGATASLLQYQIRPLVTAIEDTFGTGVVSGVRLVVDRSVDGRPARRESPRNARE